MSDSDIADVKDVPLFKGLTQGELEAVQNCLREKSFDRGEILFFEGSSCQRVFIVKSGRVKLYRTSSSGREQTLETLEPCDTCACNPGSVKWACTSTAEALVPTTVWYLSMPDYSRLIQANPNMTRALNRIFAERLRSFSCLIEEVSLKDAKRKLIRFLLDMLDEHPSPHASDNVLFIPFTREEIAQRIGAARETVARQLSQLKGLGLIDLKPKQILIRNRKGLEDLLR